MDRREDPPGTFERAERPAIGWATGIGEVRPLTGYERQEALCRVGQQKTKGEHGGPARSCELEAVPDGFPRRPYLRRIDPDDRPLCRERVIGNAEGDLQCRAGRQKPWQAEQVPERPELIRSDLPEGQTVEDASPRWRPSADSGHLRLHLDRAPVRLKAQPEESLGPEARG